MKIVKVQVPRGLVYFSSWQWPWSQTGNDIQVKGHTYCYHQNNVMLTAVLSLISIPYITSCTCAVISVWNISTVYLLDWPLFYVPPASSRPMLVWISLGMGPTSPWNPAIQKIEGPLRCWKCCASEKDICTCILNLIHIQVTH